MTSRSASMLAAACGAVLLAAVATHGQGTAQAQPTGRGTQIGAGGRGQGRGGAAMITIRAARALDGRGNTLENAVIEVQGSKITAVDQRAEIGRAHV